MAGLRCIVALLAVVGIAFHAIAAGAAAAEEITFSPRPDDSFGDGRPNPGPGVPIEESASLPGRPNIVPPHSRAALTASMTAAAHGGNEFAFDLFQELAANSSPGANVLLSPFSISTALAMTYAGAGGNTAAQMRNVLHFSDAPDEPHAGYGQWLADLNQRREGYKLSVANRLFGETGFAFRQPFLDSLSSAYQAPLERLDFTNNPEPSREHINDWVEGVTHDRIKDLIPEGLITPDTRLVLTNALYFKGGWASQFEPAATRDGVFRLDADSSQQTPMMAQTGAFRFGKFDGYRMLEMPYAGDDLSMVFVLPDAVDGLDAVAASLTAEGFQAGVDALQSRAVSVTLPKFKIEDSYNLGRSFQALGMTDAFKDFANFDDMVEPQEQKLKIDEVVHKTFLELDEQGTEAAAATAVIMVVTTGVLEPPPPELFHADRPFLFALRDRHTDGLLFLGRLADPGGQALAADFVVPEPSAALLVLMASSLGPRLLRLRRLRCPIDSGQLTRGV